MRVFLDTHSLVYLFDGEFKRFGQRSRSLIETEELVFSPASRLELAYLREKGRFGPSEEVVVDSLAADFGIREAQERFSEVAKAAAGLSWTRDLFDRLIVAHAGLSGSKLITRDATIQTSYRAAVW